jgi:mono/diheme cytochrome c family protein
VQLSTYEEEQMFSRFKQGGPLTLSLVLTLTGAACSGQSGEKEGSSQSGPSQVEAGPAAAAQPSAAAMAEAQQIFSTRCTPCHGMAGGGDGPASAGLTPKPRNFHDADWQKSVTDQYIEQIIQYGGAAVGKSPAMPSNPDLGSKAEVIAALRAHVRSLSK